MLAGPISASLLLGYVIFTMILQKNKIYLQLAAILKLNKFIFRQSVILASSCSLTSFLASFTIFSILGHMALIEGKNISEVATQGNGFVFTLHEQQTILFEIGAFKTTIVFTMLSFFSLVESAVPITL